MSLTSRNFFAAATADKDNQKDMFLKMISLALNLSA
jgi:hypothetical protein